MCSNYGKTSIRSLESFDTKVATLKDAKEWSEVARYSPDENFLAVGSHDNAVYVYSVSEAHEYSLYHKFNSSSSFINGLDWSADGKHIRTTDGAHEELFYTIESKNQDKSGV